MDSKSRSFTCNRDLSFTLPGPQSFGENTPPHPPATIHTVSIDSGYLWVFCGYFVAIFGYFVGHLKGNLPTSFPLIPVALDNPCVQKIGGRSGIGRLNGGTVRSRPRWTVRVNLYLSQLVPRID